MRDTPASRVYGFFAEGGMTYRACPVCGNDMHVSTAYDATPGGRVTLSIACVPCGLSRTPLYALPYADLCGAPREQRLREARAAWAQAFQSPATGSTYY